MWASPAEVSCWSGQCDQDRQEQQQQQQACASVIDYSRWDGICTSESGEEEEEENEEDDDSIMEEQYDIMDEQYDSMDEHLDDEQEDDNIMDKQYDIMAEQSDNEQEEDSIMDEQYDTTAEQCVFEAEQKDDSISDEQHDITFSDEDGEKNRTLLLRTLEEAGEAAQRAYAAAAAKISQQGINPSRIERMQEQCEAQLTSYAGMISNLAGDQFTRTGAMQLERLILDWKQNLCANVLDL